MRKTIKKKNPFWAGFLALFFGPFGYLYLGFYFFIASIIISIIISLVIFLLNLPYPTFFTYFQFLVFGYFGYKFAHINNILAENDELSGSDIKEYKSFSFALYLMINVMMSIIRFYALIVGIFFVISAFSQGKIFFGLLILFFGIGLAQYVLESIFSLISIAIMKLFKIDKKYL